MKKLLFQLSVAGLVFFASRKGIVQLAKTAGFDEHRTFQVVRKARVWLIMFVLFSVPFCLWACLAGTVFFQLNMPLVTVTGTPFDKHFEWLWYNLDGNTAFAVVVLGAFPMKALLYIEWICWNKLTWEREMNRQHFSENNSDKLLY